MNSEWQSPLVFYQDSAVRTGLSNFIANSRFWIEEAEFSPWKKQIAGVYLWWGNINADVSEDGMTHENN